MSMMLGGIHTCQNDEEIGIMQAELTGIPEGDIIEVGVFMGGTTKVLANRYPERTIYACDTFTGHPHANDEKGDSIVFPQKVGDMAVEFSEVEENLKNLPNVKIVKGTFPQSAKTLKDKTFAFAHLDVDVYQSNLESLDFVLPRMIKGGKILIHDYPHYVGIKDSTDEFCAKNNLEVTKLSQRQGIIRI